MTKIKDQKIIYKKFTPFAKNEEAPSLIDNQIYKQTLKDALNLKLVNISHLSVNDSNNIKYINVHAFYKSNFLIRCKKKYRRTRKFNKIKKTLTIDKKKVIKKISNNIMLFNKHSQNLKLLYGYSQDLNNNEKIKSISDNTLILKKVEALTEKEIKDILLRKEKLNALSSTGVKTIPNKRLNSILRNKNLLTFNKFSNKLKFKIKPLNFKIKKKLLCKCQKYFRYYQGSIFPIGHRIYYDFLKMTALMTTKQLSLNSYLEILNNIFKYLDKRRHGKFLALLKQTMRVLITSSKKSRICGIKLILNGKIRGKNRAKTIKMSRGRLHRSSADYHVAFGKTPINTKYGTFGLTAWVTYRKKIKKNAIHSKRIKIYKKTKRNSTKQNPKTRKSLNQN